MFKLVVVVCFACACAAPLDTKVDAKNQTEKSTNDEKAVTYTNYGEFYNPRPMFYSMPGLPVAKPILSSPLIRPSPLPVPYLVDGKTAHLRPQLYQGQQVYSYPVQSYPQSGYSYSSYPSYLSSYQPSYQPYSYYGGYGYKNGKEEPTPSRVIIEKPQEQIPMTPEVSHIIPRDASWTPYTALPQDNFGQLEDIRRRDVLIDDKFNMQIQPSYLMDRLHLQSPQARSADDFSSEFSQSPEDDVYVVMNQYDQHPVAKAAFNEFQPIGNAQVNSIWMPPVFNSPVLPSQLRDVGTPFSSENIFGTMTQTYNKKYLEQMDKAHRNLQPKSADQSGEAMKILAEELVNKIKTKKTEPTPVKTEEKEVTTAAPKTNA